MKTTLIASTPNRPIGSLEELVRRLTPKFPVSNFRQVTRREAAEFCREEYDLYVRHVSNPGELLFYMVGVDAPEIPIPGTPGICYFN